MATWLRQILLPRRAPGVRIPQVEDLEELKVMLRDQEIDWSRAWKEKGLREGRREGRREGEVEVLLHQLRRKFGPLDAATREQVQAADSRTLKRWAERVLNATTLAETLGRSRPRLRSTSQPKV